jgi:uncharacterized small protein (DUF1192 family)
MIVAVVKSDQTGHHVLRQYACDALEKEFLDTTMPGDKRIEIADVSLESLRDKIIASLENVSENIVEDVRIVTQNDLVAFIQKMRVDKAYGDITMLLTLQLMLSQYAGIVLCQVVHGSLSEENLVPLVYPRFVIRLCFYPMPTTRANECHYDYIMDCNPDARGIVHQEHSKALYKYTIIWSRCFWNSHRFVIKDTGNSGKGLFAADVFANKSIVSIYPNDVCYGSLDSVPEDCDQRHMYIQSGFYYCNAKAAEKYIWDEETATYVPLPKDSNIGLAMFINSSDGEETCIANCKMDSVDVWDPSISNLTTYKCVVATEEIGLNVQFIIKYNMEGANTREKEKEEKGLGHPESNSVVNRGRPHKNNTRPSIVLDSKASKHFDSSVAALPVKMETKQKRLQEKDVEGGQPLKRQRQSVRLAHAATVAIEADQPGEQKTKKTRGPGKKKRPNIEEPDVKEPKKEKTPRTIRLEVAPIDTTPKDVLQNDVAKTKSDMESDFAQRLVDMEANFQTEKGLIEAKCITALDNAASAMKKEHQSDLQIRILEVNAVHARVVSDLNVTISELRERLRCKESEILSLEDQLAPYQVGTDAANALLQIKQQDSYGISDDRLDAYNARLQSQNDRRFRQRAAWTRTESTLLPSSIPSPILPALLPTEPQLALPQPPPQQALLPVVPVVPVLEVKAEKLKTN